MQFGSFYDVCLFIDILHSFMPSATLLYYIRVKEPEWLCLKWVTAFLIVIDRFQLLLEMPSSCTLFSPFFFLITLDMSQSISTETDGYFILSMKVCLLQQIIRRDANIASVTNFQTCHCSSQWTARLGVAVAANVWPQRRHYIFKNNVYLYV